MPLSPPEFPQRNGSTRSSRMPVQTSQAKSFSAKPLRKSPKQKQPESPNPPSISLWGHNPFSDTRASGDTPKIPQESDPLLDYMFRMKSVAAEQLPTVITPDGRRSTSPRKGEFVTDRGLKMGNTQTQTCITTDHSIEATAVLPAMAATKSRTTVPRVGHLRVIE